jgi:hypothetical protein
MSLNGDCLSREDEENIMESSRSLPEINRSTFVSLTEKSKDERPRSEINDAARSRRLTAKGEAYVENKLHQDRTLAGAALRRKITYINRMLEQPNEISVLERLRDDLDSLRERLDEAHQIYYSKISPGEINEAYEWYDIRDREHFQCRRRINEAIKAQELVMAPERFSQRSSRTKSSRSSGSSSSSVRSRLAKAAAKAATLEIEMDFIDQEAEHKRQKMLKEIAKAKAKEKAMKKLEKEFALKETISTHQNNDMEAYFEANNHRVINVKESGQPRHVERRVLDSSSCIHKDDPIKQEFVPEQIDPALLESQQDGFIPKVELNKAHDN